MALAAERAALSHDMLSGRQFLLLIYQEFPDMHCMKRVYRDKKASFHWSAAKKKERFSSR